MHDFEVMERFEAFDDLNENFPDFFFFEQGFLFLMI